MRVPSGLGLSLGVVVALSASGCGESSKSKAPLASSAAATTSAAGSSSTQATGAATPGPFGSGPVAGPSGVGAVGGAGGSGGGAVGTTTPGVTGSTPSTPAPAAPPPPAPATPAPAPATPAPATPAPAPAPATPAPAPAPPSIPVGVGLDVDATTLNVRSGPGTQHAVIGSAHRGESYVHLQQQGVWHKLQFGAREGWAHGSYLKRSARSVTHVTASSLNVRSGAGSGYRQVGQLARNARVVVRASAGSWRQVSFEGQNAWVHGAYLANSGVAAPAPTPTRPTSRAGFIQLPATGSGFRSYTTSNKRWGIPRLIYAIERAGRRWTATGYARMGVGNISLENGGRFPPHQTHRVGKNVDVRPMRTSGEGAVTITQSYYSRTRTRRLIEIMRAETAARSILFNDRAIPGVVYYAGHHNHFHLTVN